jgi:hypothetical protein
MRCFAVLLLLTLMIPSCRSAKSVVAAVEVKPTQFLPHAAELKEDRKRSPFLGNWWNPDKHVQAAAAKVRQIYIAPVVTDHLRPMKQKLTKLEFSEERRNKKMASLAKYTHDKFYKAFKQSKLQRFSVVDAPSKNAMTLKLSIFEWEPNTVTGLIAREAVDLVTLPMVGDLLAKPARGQIAIEGILEEPRTKKSFFEFADKEEARTLFFFFPQELFASGQAKYAIREWARQFEKLMSTPDDVKVRDSLPFQIIAF